jgi:hypothetical protein
MTLVMPTQTELRSLLPIVDGLLSYATSRLAKASREALREAVLPDFEADVAAFFRSFADRIGGKVAKAIAVDWADDTIDWTVEDDELEAVLARWYATLGEGAYAAVSEQLATELRWDLNQRGVARVMDRVAVEIQQINEASREYLRRKVQQAIDRGYSVEQLVRGVPDDGWGGILQLVESWASTAEGGAVGRARTIALTETATAYNAASVAGYRDSGLVDEVEVYDGPDCGWTDHDDPDLADGSIRTLDEADEYPEAHPNCQRAFGPVVVR